MKTNLDILHRVPEILTRRGSTGRQIGKTYYACHCVAGYLEVLQNTTIMVFIPRAHYLKFWVETLSKVLQEHGMEIEVVDRASRRIFVKYNTNSIKIVTADAVQSCHPLDFGIDPDLYPILDIDNLHADFWNEVNNVTVKNFDKIARIRNFTVDFK